MKKYNHSEIENIRGHGVVSGAGLAFEDRAHLLEVVDWFVKQLNEADQQDLLGTEGWRHYFGVED